MKKNSFKVINIKDRGGSYSLHMIFHFYMLPTLALDSLDENIAGVNVWTTVLNKF